MAATVKGKSVSSANRTVNRAGSVPGKRLPSRSTAAPQPKSFDVSQDEVIQNIRTQSGVYRQLTSQDLLKFDTTDDPRAEAELPRGQNAAEDAHVVKDEIVKFQQALKLYEQGNFIAAYLKIDQLAQQSSIPYQIFYKAIMLYDGMGTTANPTEAVRLMKNVYDLTKSSLLDIELRHLACYHIGNAYNSGFGVYHDGAESVAWWRKAAEEVLFVTPEKASIKKQTVTDSGPLCQSCLGSYYSRAAEIGPDWPQSFFWHSEAARNGSVESVVQLGLLNWYGLGCTRNDDAAHKYLLSATEHGNYSAMGHLGVFYVEKKLFESAYLWVGKILVVVEENKWNVESTVSKIARPGTHNQDEDGIWKSVVMCFFVMGYLHETGKVLKEDRDLARSFYRKADKIDDELVGFLR